MPRTSELLERILPFGTVGVEAEPADSEEPLWAEEMSLAVGARPARIRELAAGRSCARRALAMLGAPVTAVLADSRRVPSWPEGVVGSITHTEDFVAVVVGWQSQVSAIGIDAERVARVRPAVMPMVATPAELAWIASRVEPHRAIARALVFSAKEAIYKCQFPITRELLDFLDLAIEVEDPARGIGAFRGIPRSATAIRVLPPIAGRFVVTPGLDLVVALAVLDPSGHYAGLTANSGK